MRVLRGSWLNDYLHKRATWRVLRLLLQVALALGKIHVRYLGKLLCENPLAKSVGRICEGNPWLPGTVQVSGALPGGGSCRSRCAILPGGVVARERQLYPMGGLSLRWLPYREAEGGQESREGRQENVDHHRPFGFAFTRHSRLILLQ